jgi:N utilization substance protein B
VIRRGRRRRGREAALQLLYQREVGGVEIDEAARILWTVRRLSAAERAFAEALARDAVTREPQIDALLASHAEHWRVSRMAVVDRVILRLATAELLGHPETPPPVVIDEAVELARTFSTADSPAFVNGVLDAIRRSLAAGAPPPPGGAPRVPASVPAAAPRRDRPRRRPNDHA